MSSGPDTDAAISDFYNRAPEEHRLERGAFLLEALRTRELIARYAPPPPATVFDIGGAAGAYALWMAQAGYTVHLIDATPRLVAEATRRSAAAEWPLASCAVGDARRLAVDSASADVVLLLGPLYHLTNRSDRVTALEEAARILRPGGCLFAAAISRWASTLDGLTRNRFSDPTFVAIVERDLQDGQHRNPGGRLDYFTTAYLHRPEDLLAEAVEAGVAVRGIFGIEGPGWLLPDVQDRLDVPARRDDLMRVARIVETEPSIVGISAHLLLVAERPRG